jgi:hypothetical protein
MTLEQELQERLRLAWEAQSLLTDLITAMTSDLPRQQAYEEARNLLRKRLIPLIDGPQFVMALAASARTFKIVASSGDPPDLGVIGVREALMNQFMPGKDYVPIEIGHPARSEAIYLTMGQTYAVENFPLWRGDRFIGFVAFASATSLLDQPQLSLIKATVRGVLTLSSE